MINRLQATRYIVDHITDEPIIASLGNAKFDLFTAKDRPQNSYMWNSMGMASSMGLGLAMARPQQTVIILDGDGSLLMHVANGLRESGDDVPDRRQLVRRERPQPRGEIPGEKDGGKRRDPETPRQHRGAHGRGRTPPRLA